MNQLHHLCHFWPLHLPQHLSLRPSLCLLPLAVWLSACQPSGRCYRAEFPSWDAMPNRATVRIAGVVAGKVVEQKRAGETRIAVRFCLEEGIRLRQGTGAILRAKSALGERYVELQAAPADAPELGSDEIIEGISPPRVEDLGELLWPVAQSFPPERITQLLDLLAWLPQQLNDGPALGQLENLLTISERMLRQNEKPINRLIYQADKLQKALGRLEKRLRRLDDAKLRQQVGRIQKLIAKLQDLANRDFEPLARLSAQAATLASNISKPGHGWPIAKEILQREGLSGSLFSRSPQRQKKDIESYPVSASPTP